MLDGGDEIVLANWPNDKHIIWNINNDIPVKIPRHPYVSVNRSILCNCSIEADNHYLLESIATCDNRDSKQVMYFTINTPFVNYLDMFPSLTDLHQLIKDRTTYEQPLPINLCVLACKNYCKFLLAFSNLYSSINVSNTCVCLLILGRELL